MTDSILIAIILIPCLIVAIVFHEVAHGWAARSLGDPTAAEKNRLSLNPLRHVDPIGTVILPGILFLSGAPVFGWAKPVPVNFNRLNNPRRDMMIVAAAGPGTNFILALLGAVIYGLFFSAEALSSGPSSILGFAIFTFIGINIFLGLFNLLPLPPFDGSHIVEGMLPDGAARSYAKLRPYGFPLLIVLLLVIPWLFPGLGIIEKVILPPYQWALGFFQQIAMAVAGG